MKMTELESASQKPKTRRRVTSTQTSIRPVVPVKMARSYKKVMMISIVGLTIMSLGIIVGSLWSTMLYELLFAKLLTLTQTSFNFNMWVETPVPMYLKFYMFNWTNPHEFLANASSGVKPHFQEMGPYVFREIDYKINRVWNENGTVTFQRRKIWFFEQSLSNGDLTDQVTNINPIVATVATAVKGQSAFIRKLVNGAMVRLGEKLVITKSVKMLIFEGFNDTLLELARKMKLTNLPYSKFGWFYSRNGSDTYDGTFNMLTGANNLFGMGMIKEWNYSNRTDDYTGSCSMIHGTLGDFWPPLANNDTIPVFVPDICTYLDFKFEETTKVEGITGNKYIGTKDMLDNGESVPSRRCFCSNGNCEPSGTLNISSCKFGAPAFVSMPHFYLADPSYTENITGMSPDKQKHELLIILEPTTGAPLSVKAQLQLNLLLEPVADMSMFENIKKTYIPMLWFTQEANLTAEYSGNVELLLILPSLGSVTFFGIAGIGVLIFFIGIFIYIRQRWRGEESQVLISKYDGDVRTRDEM
ncbi:PREDICTED: protein croquemort-like [Cyphomyrmex costatus]|uniref:protein croquemort-like n=1 Tax=Cyphomyrmex costatus TaxID=456900 RepID=UPI000852295F|nr:PREDICTED: protein croquemort-like [Cyphomyrmex costatus]